MYGTIARLIVKPGALETIQRIETERMPAGYIGTYVYQADSNPNELWMVVLFENRESYLANARSPEQHQQYLQMRAMLEQEPQWHDGEIVFAAEKLPEK